MDSAVCRRRMLLLTIGWIQNYLRDWKRIGIYILPALHCGEKPSWEVSYSQTTEQWSVICIIYLVLIPWERGLPQVLVAILKNMKEKKLSSQDTFLNQRGNFVVSGVCSCWKRSGRPPIWWFLRVPKNRVLLDVIGSDHILGWWMELSRKVVNLNVHAILWAVLKVTLGCSGSGFVFSLKVGPKRLVCNLRSSDMQKPLWTWLYWIIRKNGHSWYGPDFTSH